MRNDQSTHDNKLDAWLQNQNIFLHSLGMTASIILWCMIVLLLVICFSIGTIGVGVLFLAPFIVEKFTMSLLLVCWGIGLGILYLECFAVEFFARERNSNVL